MAHTPQATKKAKIEILSIDQYVSQLTAKKKKKVTLATENGKLFYSLSKNIRNQKLVKTPAKCLMLI